MNRCVALIVVLAVALCACGGEPPAAPSSVSVPAPAPSPSPGPGPAPGADSSSAVRLNDDFGGRQLFPSDNWWNQDISAAPVDPQSASSIAFIGATRTAS